MKSNPLALSMLLSAYHSLVLSTAGLSPWYSFKRYFTNHPISLRAHFPSKTLPFQVEAHLKPPPRQASNERGRCKMLHLHVLARRCPPPTNLEAPRALGIQWHWDSLFLINPNSTATNLRKWRQKYKDVLKPPAKVKILKTLVSSFKLPFTTLYMTKNFVKHILYEMALWPSTVQIHLDWRILPKQRQKLIKFGPRDGFTSNAKNLATLFIGQHLQCRLLLAGGEIRDFSQACGGRIVFEPNRAWRCFCYPEMSQVCKLSNLVWGGKGTPP